MDSWGMGMACILLECTLDTGRNLATIVQWDTAQGVTTLFNNLINMTPSGISLACLSAESGPRKTYFSNSPAKGFWYTQFSSGCHTRMGDVHLPDKALTIDVLGALL